MPTSKIQLKPNELTFMRYCCHELTYRQIAKLMGKSPRTIDGYRDALFRKLGVRSKTGIVLYGFKYSLLKKKDIFIFKQKKKRR